MGCLSYLVGTGADKAAEKAKLAHMKNGKTIDQQNAIDFFLLDNSGCGCTGCGSNGSKMTMGEYQQLVSNRLYNLNLKQKAMDKIGLDESEIQEIPPIPLSSYVFDEGDEGDDVWIKVIGEEAVSSRFSVSWIFFSATQLYAYTYTFDMVSDNTWEKTQDFFYQDITCFTTAHKVVEQIDYSIVGCIKKGENAVKNNYVVDSLSIVLPGTSFSFSMRNSDSLEQSLQAAKAMLRERKFAN